MNKELFERLDGHIGRDVVLVEESFENERWIVLAPETRRMIDLENSGVWLTGEPAGYFAPFDGPSRRIKEIRLGEEVLYERD